MGKINLLAPNVANLIAAGEVVDRPASAVKELLENAIDSGAENITVEIQRGGISFIRVADDGCGIEKDDLAPAITRHSTSKISTAADLDAIFTLGFRGEALAAIASVSKLRIFSKVRGEEMGALLESDGGKILSITDTGCREGTTIIVEDLFHNVPARRKFLKKDATEATAIGAVVEKIALSRPDIAFKYISDGEIKFMTTGKGNLSEAIYALFGREFATRSLKVDREENGIRITGYISESDLCRSNRNYENFFINGRYIKSKTASAALEQAYSSKIPQDKFPFCVLNIELNPAAVDVNVHPAKLEVKFTNEKLIFDAVYYAVLSALEKDALRPELSLDTSKSAKAAQKTGQSRPTSSYASAFVPQDKRNTLAEQIRLANQIPGVVSEKVPVKPVENTIFPKEDDPGQYVEKLKPSTAEPYRPKPQPAPPSRTAPAHTESENASKAHEAIVQAQQKGQIHASPQSAQSAPVNRPAPTPPAATVPAPAKKAEPAEDPEPLKLGHPNTKSEPEPTQNLALPEMIEIRSGDIPEYHIIGEAFNCYVMVQIADRILMIDKHAAHERILFDELCRKMHEAVFSGQRGSQMLLAPLEIDILASEADAMKEYDGEIEALGFDYTTVKKGVSSCKAVITAIPEILDTTAAIELFTTLAQNLADATASVESAAGKFFESRLWQASCKAAIKGGRVYDIAHIKWICDRLLKKPDGDNQVIRTCPHGRPVAFEIKKSSIDRQFARLG